MNRFSYLLEKIKTAPVITEPFQYVLVENLFSEADLAEIVADPQVSVPLARSDRDLFDVLSAAGYGIVEFPGCIVDKEQYLRSRKRQLVEAKGQEANGVAFRLRQPGSSLLKDLTSFIESDDFTSALASKLNVDTSRCTFDGGLQKYLDGYEISPHPDIRRKALTYMININPHAESETLDHHTQYMTLKPAYKYVSAFWEGNLDIDRCWLPWEWCETFMTQTMNNSLVFFSPSNDTLHAIRANYDHLPAQRTQLYGNLWYAKQDLRIQDWRMLDLHEAFEGRDREGVWARVVKGLAWRRRKFLSRAKTDTLDRNV